ncbi:MULTISPECIES: Gfo/Idh/MocA family protein [Enterobacteriaceae]|nr:MULTISPECIES: Gfo/Idh/MocA family oxidoreductase [Enterobacteriaceae]HAT3920395.1 Gfo/Idh/MocA family oxidoreductase [Kluyvera ascorbata]BBQ83257.1 oxidoreductase [Klebsiella sp. WP3-W18-ESBL-02]BBR20352.1 oxidoreductase [Klebsiella sp. WP3-S18-ESBL-05]BBR59485.1 oxidoreductase [Klebsiella sp. WP4-W18-ESBL-05]BBS91179.1 oxidoreductase [Klebsiella sp. WP7-S18-CRE-02]
MKYVIVGSGNISNTYLRAVEHIEGSTIVGCISRRGRTPQAAGDLPCWPDLSAVDRDYDAVIVATPNGLHHQSAIQAAEAGKHVLVEKPLEITLSAADRMIASAEAAGVVLAVAYQRRTRPDNMALKALLESGALGKRYSVDVSCRFWRDQAYYDSADYRGGYAIDGGGVFIQQGAHHIDNYLWLFGMPVSVTSELATFAHQMEAEDHGAAIFRHADGMIGTFVASTCARPGFSARLEFSCEKGSFTVTDDRITQWYIDGIDNPSEGLPETRSEGAHSAVVTDTFGHQAILRDFANAVVSGAAPLCSGRDARRATELVLQIYKRRVE